MQPAGVLLCLGEYGFRILNIRNCLEFNGRMLEEGHVPELMGQVECRLLFRLCV